MNSNIENILLSPALVFQAGTIDLQLLDRKERKAEILKRVPDVTGSSVCVFTRGVQDCIFSGSF